MADRSAASLAAPVPDGWLSIGHVRRPHGLRGDVFVQLLDDRDGRVVPGAEFHGSGRRFTVTDARRAGNGRIIARFEGFADRTAVVALTNTELFAAPLDDPDALWVHDLITKRVIDQRGIDRGECVAVVANPAADLIEVDTGALVPSNFVVSITALTILVEIPEGLFEVQLDHA